jgi:hypothetical protein
MSGKSRLKSGKFLKDLAFDEECFSAFEDWRVFAYPLQTQFTATTKPPRLS